MRVYTCSTIMGFYFTSDRKRNVRTEQNEVFKLNEAMIQM